LLRCTSPQLAHRDVSLRRTDWVAIGGKRTCQERRERPDATRLTQSERTALAETLLAARTSDALSQRGG